VTEIRVALVDVLVVCEPADFMFALLLRRAPGGRNPGSWEGVHGTIDADESPLEAARREVREETGFTHGTWYNLSRVESFYRHDRDEVALIPVFALVLPEQVAPTLSDEHDDFTWLSLRAASERASWPRYRRSMGDLVKLLIPTEDSVRLDDVLRID
jgi:8-oxo-dGTP pyrophosphatase MutT (NUDIX family)